MSLAKEAFNELFPGVKDDRKFIVSYSGKFKGFNANVKYSSSFVHFSLSKEWLEFGDDLKKGVIQHLLKKMFRRKSVDTLELDLYSKFMKNLNRYSKVSESDVELSRSFNRINEVYFSGLMEKPNLVWGKNAFRKLGHYEFASNTVLISNIFRGYDELIDYLMYHELLHKKHGAETKNGRMIHHSKAFKKDEALYNDKNAEKKLHSFLRNKHLRSIFKFF